MIRRGYYALRICGKRIKRCRVRLSVRLSVCPSGSARYSSKAVLRQAKRVVTDTAAVRRAAIHQYLLPAAPTAANLEQRVSWRRGVVVS